MPDSTSSITHDPDRSRFDLVVDGEPAGRLDYEREGDLWSLTHTEVDPARGGRGLGSRLVLHALRTVAAEGGQVLPLCPFVPRVLAEHPDLVALVPVDQRARFGLA